MTKNELNQKIGQRIIEFRKQKGWSQSDLARACDKDRQALERLEKGKVNPTAYTLLQISEALEIDLWELLQFQDKHPNLSSSTKE